MSYQQPVLLFWDKQAVMDEAGVDWVLKPAACRVGSHWEKMFWRVITNNATAKEFYLCPEDYFLRSGVDPAGFEEQIAAWNARYQAIEAQLLATQPTLSTAVDSTSSFADITAAHY